MAEKIDLRMVLGEDLNLDARWRERQDARDQAEFEALLGAGGPATETPIDTSEEGLAKSADAGARMEPAGDKLRPSSQSSSEEVRTRAQKISEQPLSRKVADAVLKAATGGALSMDDFSDEALAKGDLGAKVGMKMSDPVGNVFETLARQHSKEAGLDETATEDIAGFMGLAAGMLTPGGGKKKALQKIAGAGKAGEVAKIN